LLGEVNCPLSARGLRSNRRVVSLLACDAVSGWRVTPLLRGGVSPLHMVRVSGSPKRRHADDKRRWGEPKKPRFSKGVQLKAINALVRLGRPVKEMVGGGKGAPSSATLYRWKEHAARTDQSPLQTAAFLTFYRCSIQNILKESRGNVSWLLQTACSAIRARCLSVMLGK
jgi:hypothetical protein